MTPVDSLLARTIRKRSGLESQPSGPRRRRAVMEAPEIEQDQRLESWKEIAAYLNRQVRTVQRWEKLEGR